MKFGPKCPKCGGGEVVRIVYGYPGEDLKRRANEGRVVLGGCCVDEGDPTHACRTCGHSWNADTPAEAPIPPLV